MRIAVWRTSHEIADTVASSITHGLDESGIEYITAPTSLLNDSVIEAHDLHIGYGILRGMDKVFDACGAAGKPWIHLDKGYWKPGHYDGYYRISLRGTQQTFGLDKLTPDYERLEKLGISILPPKKTGGVTLVCPPTEPVYSFFNEDRFKWSNAGLRWMDETYRVREKWATSPIDWDECRKIITFNSSVGWEALRQGIPVISDPQHSIVGAYQKLVDGPLYLDIEARRRLFALMASLQLTLEEIRSGLLWPLIQQLLSVRISVGTAEKPLQVM